jgi:RNA polymerase sigma factor (TIGR02999 family)
MQPTHDVTELLLAHGRGDAAAFDRLVGLVYDDLRRLARGQLRRMRPGQTLDTTALVHEAYVRLVDQRRVPWQDRGHFLAVTATAMRQILIDYARARTRHKRGGGAVPATLDEAQIGVAGDAEALLEINRALERLGEIDPRLVRVVECRYFAGYSEQETATALGVSLRTAQRDWLRARAWLREALRPS